MSTNHSLSLMDFLSAIFFIIAGVWLSAAILYSLMVLYFLRLRSLQLLHIIHDDTFGRLYIFPKWDGSCCCCCGFGSRHNSSNGTTLHDMVSNDPTGTTPSQSPPSSQQQQQQQQREYYYISLGWIFRRYARHLNLDVRMDLPERDTPRPRYKRSERRAAIQLLLLKQQQQQQQQKKLFNFTRTKVNTVDTASSTKRPTDDLSQIERGISITDDDDNEIPICSICLGPYEENDEEDVGMTDHSRNFDTQPLPTSSTTTQVTVVSNTTFQSSTCSHIFHMECLLNWLQRPNNTACPCCRIPMLEESTIWNTIVRLRKQHRRQQRQQQQQQWLALQKQQQQQQKPTQRQQQPEEGPIEDTTNSETEHDNV